MRIQRLLPLLFLPFLLFFQLPAEENAYQITGKIKNYEAGTTINLYRFHPVTQVKSLLANGTVQRGGYYEVSFDFSEPDLFRLEFNGKNAVVFVIDKDQKSIEINVDAQDKEFVEIKGSPDAEKLLGYEAFRKESNLRLIRPAYEAMKASTKAGSREGEVIAVDMYAKNSITHRQELLDYTEENIGTSVALYGTVLRWTGDEEIDRLEKLVNNFKAAHPKLKMTQVMVEKVERYKKVAVGAMAPNFELPDSSGQVVALKDLLGKYTLLDFWASWCSPCLLQVPDLKEAYDTYHDQGFEIVGISVDTKEKRWKSAIKKYELNWPHVSDLQGWQSTAANEYNVTFLPFNLLIGPDGKIVAKNLHSVSLTRKTKRANRGVSEISGRAKASLCFWW